VLGIGGGADGVARAAASLAQAPSACSRGMAINIETK